MKTIRILLPVVAAILGAFLLLEDSSAQPRGARTPATSVAVCDIMDLLNNYERAKDVVARLTTASERIQREGKARGEKIQETNQQLDSLKLGSPEYRKVLAEMEKDQVYLAAWLKMQTGRSMREHHRLTKLLYTDIRTAIGKVAKARGIQIVLAFNRRDMPTNTSVQLAQLIDSRKVIWRDDAIDLTDAVLTKLNKDYKAPKR